MKAIVAAGGNDGGDSTLVAPANCGGVIAVTAIDRAGARASYASGGANIALAAPGGSFPANVPNGEDGILSLFNTGLTTPLADAFAFGAGTSQAAAHVSGVTALVLSANPSLSAAALRDLLQRTARPFPDATCNTNLCGTGIVDAAAAVSAAAQPDAGTMAAGAAPTGSGGGGGGGGGAVPWGGTAVRNGHCRSPRSGRRSGSRAGRDAAAAAGVEKRLDDDRSRAFEPIGGRAIARA